jgi:hypothetical protein
MRRNTLLICLLACTIQLHGQSTPAPAGTPPVRAGAAARPPRYIESAPYDFNDHAGWQSMFDGSTLKGWQGPMDLWRVESGSIVSTSTAANPNGSAYLNWGGDDLKNFEFKTEIKLEGQGANSGVQFRAQMLGKTDKKNSEWESFGYQADYDYTNGQTGALIECCSGPGRGPHPRPFKASIGTVVRETLSDPDKPTVIGTLGDPDELKKLIHVGDWNQLHIIVRGTMMMYILNGRLMSVFLDDNPQRFLDHGVLQLQLEGRGDIKVSFRNIWLKMLP